LAGPAQKIHIFIGIIADRMCCLLQLKLEKQGITTNINQMIEAMPTMKHGTTFLGIPDKNNAIKSFTQCEGLAEQIEGGGQTERKICNIK